MKASEEKAALRRMLREMKVEEKDRLEHGRNAAQTLREWPAYQSARVVGCFFSTSREVDTRPVLKEILEDGKILALPRVTGPGRMDFFETRLNGLVPGAYGILEPEARARLVPPEELALLLVPAEGIDRQGWRLGKGGGFYDRYLPKTRCTAAALVLPHQWGLLFPHEPHDARVDWCLAGKNLYRMEKGNP